VVQGIRATTDSTDTQARLALVEVGERTATPASDTPRDIHFFHVDLQSWLMRHVKTGAYLNGAGHIFRDGRCTEIHQPNADSHCLLSISGPGPFLYENNLLEAASENIMFGGGDPSVVGLVPSDITIRGNLIRKNPAWKSIGTPTQSGSYLIKLLIEAKNASRALVEYNKLDGVWEDGQTGYAIALKSVNQHGGCRWCRVTDWTIRHNTIVNVGAGFGFAGAPEPSPVDSTLRRVRVEGNWIDSLNVGIYTGDQRGVLLGWQARDIQFIGNTWASGNYGREAFILARDDDSTAVFNLRFDRNIMPIGVYGWSAAKIGEGSTALNSVAIVGYRSMLNNVFIGAARPNYPASTRWTNTLAEALATGAGVAQRPVP
jgi:hypothetical protein